MKLVQASTNIIKVADCLIRVEKEPRVLILRVKRVRRMTTSLPENEHDNSPTNAY